MTTYFVNVVIIQHHQKEIIKNIWKLQSTKLKIISIECKKWDINEDGEYNCFLCSKSFKYEYSLRRHLKLYCQFKEQFNDPIESAKSIKQKDMEINRMRSTIKKLKKR